MQYCEEVKGQRTPQVPWVVSEALARLAKNAIYYNLAVPPNDASLGHCGLDFDYLYQDYMDKALTVECQPTGTVAFGMSKGLASLRDVAILAFEQAGRGHYIRLEPKVYVSHATEDSGAQSHAGLLQAFLATQDRYQAVPALGVVPFMSQLAGLPRGWDGYEGEHIQLATVDRALDVLSSLSTMAVLDSLVLPRPDVGPTPAGSILFEWDLPTGYFSVDCPPDPEPLSLYIERRHDGSEEERTSASVDDFWPMISPLLSKADSATRAAFHMRVA